MTELKKLQEMAKNGEVSKKLLGNQDFKSELKEALKEEKGIAATEKQISEIIKDFEKALQSDTILKNAELETISGGGNGATKVAAAATNATFTGAGAVAGTVLGTACGIVLGGAPVGIGEFINITSKDDWADKDKIELVKELYNTPKAIGTTFPHAYKVAKIGAGIGGGIGFFKGAKKGNALGHKVCVAMGLEKS